MYCYHDEGHGSDRNRSGYCHDFLDRRRVRVTRLFDRSRKRLDDAVPGREAAGRDLLLPGPLLVRRDELVDGRDRVVAS